MKEATKTEVTFVRWPNIELFHNLMKHVTKAHHYVENGIKSGRIQITSKEGIKCNVEIESALIDSEIKDLLKLISKPIIYRGKVKLHGSNGGVTLEGGEVRAQSRNIFIEKDHFGSIVFKNKEYFQSLHNSSKYKKVTVFGEYCGPSVQRSLVALSHIDECIFAVFAVLIGEQLIVEPTDIEDFMTKGGTTKLPPNVHILPWQTEEMTLDLTLQNQDKSHAEFLARIEDAVVEIDALDPWVKGVFGVEGPGEGLVLYPLNFMEDSADVEEYKTLDAGIYARFAFKAKGPKHRVVASKKSVQISPHVAEGAEEFVTFMCPDARFEQGVEEVGGFKISKLKAFGEWVVKDVNKEGKDELEASGLQWRDVLPIVRKKATAWYAQKTKINQHY